MVDTHKKRSKNWRKIEFTFKKKRTSTQINLFFNQLHIKMIKFLFIF